jgi:predicted nuclease of restriction endonuclease-like RecB superfamily
MKKPDQMKAMTLSNACGWACWTFENTDMPKRKVLQRASQRFGVSMAAIERAVLAAMGEGRLAERAERMVEQFKPQYAASNSRLAGMCRQLDKHLRDI